MLVADTHVHLYPFYDVGAAMRSLVRRLAALAPGAERAGFLAERPDGDAFARLRDGQWGRGSGFEFRPLDGGTLLAADGGDPSGAGLYLFAGRQIVTAERVEVLGLAMTRPVPDGRPAAETVARVREAGGVPVLSWAPGKWLFARGRVVRALIGAAAPGGLLIGDTSLRPPLWPEPLPMRAARRRGLAVIAGSDPLPFAGEDTRPGMYATRWDGGLDPRDPLGSARRLLQGPGAPPVRVGRRSGTLEAARRVARCLAGR